MAGRTTNPGGIGFRFATNSHGKTSDRSDLDSDSSTDQIKASTGGGGALLKKYRNNKNNNFIYNKKQYPTNGGGART